MTLDSQVLVCLTQEGAVMWYFVVKENLYRLDSAACFAGFPMPDEAGFLRCTLRQLMRVFGERIRDGLIVNNEIVLLE